MCGNPRFRIKQRWRGIIACSSVGCWILTVAMDLTLRGICEWPRLSTTTPGLIPGSPPKSSARIKGFRARYRTSEGIKVGATRDFEPRATYRALGTIWEVLVYFCFVFYFLPTTTVMYSYNWNGTDGGYSARVGGGHPGVGSAPRMIGWNIPPEELPHVPEHWLSYPEPNPALHYLLAITYVFFTIFSLTGNGLVIWIFCS